MECGDRTGERRIRVPRDAVGVLPAQRRPRSCAGRLAVPDRRCIGIGHEQVAQVEMQVTVRTRVLVEVHDHRPASGMANRHRSLLDRLSHGCVLRALCGLDVTAGLEPASEAAVQVQQHDVARRIEHDGGRSDMDGQRRPRERRDGGLEQPPEVIDRVGLERIDRCVSSESLEQIPNTRVRSALQGVGRVQLSTSFARTAPVESSS